MRRAHPLRRLAVVVLLMAVPCHAQPADLPLAPADGSPLPQGIKVGQVDGMAVYTDAKGHVLYGLDMRTVLRWAPDPAQYCTGDCRETWKPVAAPRGSTPNIRFPADGRPRDEPGFINPQKAPDWTVIAGAEGPQWVYKGWHLVYVMTGKGTRSAAYDGSDGMTWNTLKFVPPKPRLSAPPLVSARFVGGAYRLADSGGRLLFTGPCPSPCAWRPFAAPLASTGIGEWQVEVTDDDARWSRKGAPVFVAETDDLSSLPAGAEALQP